MRATALRPSDTASVFARPMPSLAETPWSQPLPTSWRELVVPPQRFEVFAEYEMAADRTMGYDEDGEPAYCRYRYLLTDLRSDDDEEFYEALAHAETITAWRLRDNSGWLVRRDIDCSFGDSARLGCFALSDTMPR